MKVQVVNNRNECKYCKWGEEGEKSWHCGKPSGNFMSRTWQSCEHFKGLNENIKYKIDRDWNINNYEKEEAKWRNKIKKI